MHRTTTIIALAASGLFSTATPSAASETITVCASGCDYTSIRTAISNANDGDVIQLAAETYFEGEQIDTDGKAITLRGILDKAGEPASVLDGAGAHRVLICQSGETNATVFENLVIQNGYAIDGGGMYNQSSSPTLTDCTFTSNWASFGSGMRNNSSSPTLTNCSFENNSGGYEGGGILNDNGSSPTLISCTFTGNWATSYGGGMYNEDSSSPNLTDCTFTDNSAYGGGGMYNDVDSSPNLTDCTFTSNTAASDGGGMYNASGSPTLADCNFCGNTNSTGYDSIAGGAINGRSSGNNLLEAPCVVGDINFDGDYNEDDARAAMADFGITEGNDPVAGDADGDGDVDADDRTAVNDALGLCAADIDGDGQVDGADLSYILGYWGLCSAP